MRARLAGPFVFTCLLCLPVAQARAGGAPLAPTSLTAAAETCHIVRLDWKAPADSASGRLKAYKIFRDGSFLRWVMAPETTVNDRRAEVATTHTYTVAALSSTGLLSERSGTATATTPGCADPDAPTGLTATPSGCGTVELSWSPPADSASDPLVAYKAMRDGAFLRWVLAPATVVADRSVAPGTQYAYSVAALYDSGTLSPASPTRDATIPTCGGPGDSTPPTVPGTVAAGPADCHSIMVTWGASRDDESGVAGYNIYRDSVLLATIDAPATSTLDAGLVPGTTHAYAITASDNAGNESAATSSVSGTTPACPNLPPVADAGANQSSQSLVMLTFSGAGSFDPDGSIVSYAWTFGDGAQAEGISVTHAYSKPGDYVATITVTDNGNLAGSDTVSVHVANRPPVAKAGPDDTVVQGTALHFDGAASSDQDGSIVSYAWDFGDGSSASGAGVDHTYAQAGSYTATLTVTDDHGASSQDGRLITVTASPADDTGGQFLWVRTFGDTDTDAGEAIATDSQANTVLTGRVLGTANLGGSSCTDTIVIAKYSAAGDYRWSRCLGSPQGSGSGLGIAVDGGDNIIVTGYFFGTVDFGNAVISSAGGSDIFVAKYSAAGEPVWARRFGSSQVGAFVEEAGHAVALDDNGNVAITGMFEGTANFGSALLVSAGQNDAFVAQLSPAGTTLWAQGLGDQGYLDGGNAVAFDTAGNVLVAGRFAGTINTGSGNLSSAGASDIFLAKYSPAGTPLWARSYGGSGDDNAHAIAVDASDNVLLAGDFRSSVNFGGGLLTSAGKADIFLAKYAASGEHIWSQRFGSSTRDDSGRALAVDGGGNVFLTGYVNRTADLGGGDLTGTTRDIFVAKYSQAGTHRWSRRIGGPHLDEGHGVAISDLGVVITGTFLRTVDFGGGPVTSAGGSDVFLLYLERGGVVLPEFGFSGDSYVSTVTAGSEILE